MAMTFDKKRIFLGGAMQSVGRVRVDAVAQFKRQKWHPVEDGPETDPTLLNVMALEIFRGSLYVGGFFTNVAGIAAGGFASWRANQWSVPSGGTGVVYALKSDENSLLVGGRFSVPGYINPVALARYDKRGRWEVLNSELPPCGDEDLACIDSVDQVQLLPNGDAVCSIAFAVREWWGGFSYPYYHVLARYDTDGNWSEFSTPDGDMTGLNYYWLGSFGDVFVAGGSFTNATNSAIRNIAQWNGREWLPLGAGLEGEVYSVAGNQRVLYALHGRNVSGAAVGRSVVSRWNGNEWKRIGTVQSTDTFGRLFVSPDDDAYVTGFFSGIDTVVAPGLARWREEKWEPLVDENGGGVAGVINTVFALTEHQGSVYMGGIFLSAGDTFSDGLARWDGEQWKDVSGGIGTWFHRVRALCSSGERLFAAGVFTNIGGTSVSNVASWDGAKWGALGDGLAGTVVSLAWWQSNLYAGGRFQMSGSNRVQNIARWDGSSWQSLGGGCNSNVNAVVEWRGELYVGGRFNESGGVAVSGLAKWNGTQWADVGGGVSGIGDDDESTGATVVSLAVGADGLYIGGQFTVAGTVSATNIVRWDGTNWHTLGGGWPGLLSAIAVRDRHVFVGGAVNDENGETADGILRWDGSRWSKLGSGISDPARRMRVSALLARENDLFVGGRFPFAGGKPSANVARWVERPQLRIDCEVDALGSMRARVRGEPGLSLRLETSTDLREWNLIESDNDNRHEVRFGAPTSAKRFYRLVAE
jgi:hypothetical protein